MRPATPNFLYGTAAGINAILGWYLVRTGRRLHSLILVANGKHVSTDSWTSFGVILGLVLVLWTRWMPFDPLVAIAVGLNILWSDGQLIWKSAEDFWTLPTQALGVR